MRARITTLRAAVVLALAAVAVFPLAVRGAEEDPGAGIPASMHGAVETQALTVGVGGLSLLVDPGTAYAYSTVDRDDYGGGSVAYTMTARGANLNLGTIALAVIWAAPDCKASPPNGPCVLSGGLGTPNTGLHEAGGFPGYAEALYPPPPAETGLPSRETVYKCVVNKDAAGGGFTDGAAQDICKQSDSVPLTSWAEAVGKKYEALGFSRAGGFDVPGVIKVAGSESRSSVRHAGKGKVVSEGYSVLEEISLLGGQIKIESTRATGKIEAAAGDPGERSAACTFTGLEVAGQRVGVDSLDSAELKPLLDGIEAATKFRVEILPPTPVVTAVREGGKHVAECTGIRVNITDVSTGSPVPVCTPVVDPSVPQCVPTVGNRFEFTFGKMSIQESVNQFTLVGAGSDLVPGADLTTVAAPSDTGGTPTAVLGEQVSAPDATFEAGSQPLASPSPAGGAAPSVDAPASSAAGPSVPIKGENLALIGGLTAAATTAIGFAILLLIGVVRSLATGGPLRIPGL